MRLKLICRRDLLCLLDRTGKFKVFQRKLSVECTLHRKLLLYLSGELHPTRIPRPASDESSCGPPCPTGILSISEPTLTLNPQWRAPLIPQPLNYLQKINLVIILPILPQISISSFKSKPMLSQQQ